MAKAAPGDYAGSIQEAVKNGASPDQALRYATANVAMEVIAERVPVNELLVSVAGDPKRAAGIMDAVLKQYGIRMTGEELGWLGRVTAEASKIQQQSGFAKVIALEMLKEQNYEQARTAASRVVWQQALDWAVDSGAFEGMAGLEENAIDGRESLDSNALMNPGEAEIPLTSEQITSEAAGRQTSTENGDKRNPEAEHIEWLKSIGAENTELNTLEKFEEAKYNNSEEYQLLTGYSRAVEKHAISPLAGFDLYKSTSQDIKAAVVGQVTSTGVEIKSFCTHFIDRVIGQTSDSHKGMRKGISVSSILGALQNPVELDPVVYWEDGDIRQTFHGNGVSITISIRDGRLIQTNRWKGKNNA